MEAERLIETLSGIDENEGMIFEGLVRERRRLRSPDSALAPEYYVRTGIVPAPEMRTA